MPTVEIYDLDERQILAFDLIEILTLLEPYCDQLDWYLMEFQPAVYEPEVDANPWVLELEDKIKNSASPVKLPWRILKEFADNVLQTEFAVIVAVQPGAPPPTTPRFKLNSDQLEIVIEMFDFHLGSVTTRSQTIVDLLRSYFKNTKITERNTLYSYGARG